MPNARRVSEGRRQPAGELKGYFLAPAFVYCVLGCAVSPLKNDNMKKKTKKSPLTPSVQGNEEKKKTCHNGLFADSDIVPDTSGCPATCKYLY